MPVRGQTSRKRVQRFKGRDLLKAMFKKPRFQLVALESGGVLKVPNPIAIRDRESATIEPGWGYLFKRIRSCIRKREKETKKSGRRVLRRTDIDLVEDFGIKLRTFYRLKGKSGVRVRIQLARRVLLIALKNKWISQEEAAAPWVKFIEYEADLNAMKAIRRRLYLDKDELMRDLEEVLEQKYRRVEFDQRLLANRDFGKEFVALLPVISHVGHDI